MHMGEVMYSVWNFTTTDLKQLFCVEFAFPPRLTGSSSIPVHSQNMHLGDRWKGSLKLSLGVTVSEWLSLYVGPAMNWRFIQGLPRMAAGIGSSAPKWRRKGTQVRRLMDGSEACCTEHSDILRRITFIQLCCSCLYVEQESGRTVTQPQRKRAQDGADLSNSTAEIRWWHRCMCCFLGAVRCLGLQPWYL